VVFRRYDPLGHHVFQSLRPRILCCLQQLESYQSPQVQYEHHIRRIDPICQDSCPTVFATLSFPTRLSHSRPSFAINSSHIQPASGADRPDFVAAGADQLRACFWVPTIKPILQLRRLLICRALGLPEITASDRRRKFQAVIGAGSR